MPVVVGSGVSAVGEQIIMQNLLAEPGYVGLFLPNFSDMAITRYGWVYLYSFNQLATRRFVWRSQAITGAGTVFSTTGRPATSQAGMWLIANWKTAGIPWQVEYLTP